MSKEASGCGCGTIVVFWFLGFAILRVCGVTEVSWWYSIAPVWWPVWMLVKFVGLAIATVVVVVCVIGAVKFMTGWPHSRGRVTYRIRPETRQRSDVIDVECEDVDE